MSLPIIILPYGDFLSPGVDCSVEPSMTKQSFAAECDINTLMARYERTGVLDHVVDVDPRYGDATAIDYQQALNVVISAQGLFDDLPASVRTRFANDPARFVEFVDDPANMAESIALGLRTAPVAVPEPVPVPVPVSGASES